MDVDVIPVQGLLHHQQAEFVEFLQVRGIIQAIGLN